jgi:hypothetical protein
MFMRPMVLTSRSSAAGGVAQAFQGGDDLGPAAVGQVVGDQARLVEDEVFVDVGGLDPGRCLGIGGEAFQAVQEAVGLAAAEIAEQGALVLRDPLAEGRQQQQRHRVQRIAAGEQGGGLFGVQGGRQGVQFVESLGQAAGVRLDPAPRRLVEARDQGGLDHADGLLGGFQEGHAFEPALDLLPFVAELLAEGLGVLLEGLVQQHD